MTGEQDNTRAAAVFTGIMTLLAGGAGMLVAGLVLGCDYLLHGEPHERETLAAQRADRARARYGDALSWLEADRLDRARYRKAKRDWFTADPETRGDAPSTGETVGRVLARTWNSLIVGRQRFAKGWRDGVSQAQQRREAGEDGWWRPQRSPDTADGSAPPTNTWYCPGCNRPMSMPRDRQIDMTEIWCGPCRARQFTKIQERQPDRTADVQDAEIIPEPETPTSRDVVPVGGDPEPGADPNLDGYGGRVDALRAEVAQVRDSRPNDPSPPLSALR